MFKRGFSLAACGALALLLTAAESSQAQVFVRGGPFFWPGVGYPVGPTYANYPHPFFYNPPPTSYSGFQQYGMTTPTPIYYGSASLYYGGAAYSSGYPTARLLSPAPGVGLTAASNIGEAAYTTPNYPIQSPNYSVRYPVSPPLSAIADDTARVEVRLPADAELWFEGQKTAQTGSDRSFHSPELQPGENYVYNVHARWQADGKPVDETRKVTVHAGDHVVVNLTQPAK